MAQKSIFGMNTLKVSAGHQYSSHKGTTVVDVGDGGISEFLAPFDCEFVGNVNETNNTLVFQNTQPVQTPIGIFDKVCFRCTHMNDNEYKSLKFYEGKTFTQGTKIYYAGTKGDARGNHIHIEFAVGNFLELVEVNGTKNKRIVTDLSGNSGVNSGSCNLYLPQAVFLDPNLTTKVVSTDGNSNYYTNQYVWTLKNGVTATNYYLSYYGTGISAVNKSMKMVLTGSAARLRVSPVNGTPILTVPNGGKIEILRFRSNKESDGYRWVYGRYNGQEGYFQYDSAVMHPEGSVGTSTVPSVMMKLESSAATLRVSQVDNKIILVPNGSTLMVDEFNDAVASDGYRWARVRIDLDSSKAGFYCGWIQYDPAVMYPYSSGN